MSLVACPSCARHLRRTETACAFCGAAVSLSPPGRLAIAVALVAASAAAGCDNTQREPATQREVAAPYGVPVPTNDPRDAASAPPPSADGGDAGVAPNRGGDVYGGPPPAPKK